MIDYNGKKKKLTHKIKDIYNLFQINLSKSWLLYHVILLELLLCLCGIFIHIYSRQLI
jgi:hypothetical protein